MIKSESFNEKFVAAMTTIFACGSNQFKEMKNEDESLLGINNFDEHSTLNDSMKRNSIHFSMMLDHLQKL